MVIMILRVNNFYISDPVTLTFDPKNNGDPLLTETNHPMKFGDSVSNGSPDIEWKQFLHK